MNTEHPSPSDAHHQTPGGGGRLLKRCVVAVLIVAMQVQALAQVTSPIMRNATGAVVSGFSKNGTLMFGGQVLGNPHQLMHDMQNPTLWSTGAVSFSNSTDPTFVQATVDQMMQAIAPPSDPGGLFMSRLYLNPENPYTAGGALSAPPSPTPESDAAAPAGPLIDNFEHYKRALTHAQANVGDRTQDITRWSQTLPEYGDGVSYLAKTHTSSAVRLRNTLFDSAPSRAVFQGAQIPTPGATGFVVVQGAQARTHLANIQEQNAQLLGSRIFFSQQQLDANSRRFEARLGSQSKGTTLGYIQPDGQAHEFAQDNPFLQSGFGAPRERGEWEPAQRNMGEALNQAANQHQVRVQTLQGLDLSHFKDDRALFMQGLDLYKHVSGQERNLLDGLKNGQIISGHPQYAQARALAQGAFTQAYGDHVEYETRLKHSKESAAWQAQNINLSGISDQALFSKGYNLFDSRASEHQEGLLKRLQAGELKVGSAEYNEARTLAEARFRVDHQQALEPPKKVSSWKKLVSIVVVAVVAFYTAGAVSALAGQALGATLTTSGAVATTVTTAGVTSVSMAGVAATAIGSAAASMTSAAMGTAIQTGSVSQGMKAAGNSLKGGLTQVAVSTALATAGISGTGIGETIGVSEKVGHAIYNTVSNAVTNTIANGGSFGQHLTDSAINSTISMASQNISDRVVASTEAGGWDRYAAHAALGCGVGMVRSGSGTGCEDGAYDGVAGLMIDEVKRAQTADKKIMLKRCSLNGVCDEPVPVKSQDVVVSADGKVYVHNHGILNDESAALGGAKEMNSDQANTQGVYVVINPHAGNFLTEIIYAGYDKLNEVLGGIMPVSNATLATVDIRNRAAELGASVASTAHSRGTLTEALATQYQLRTGQENLNISSQFFYGGAANAQRAADQLSKATNGEGQLYQSTHTSDPVGTLIGGNEPTGGVPWSNPIEAHVQYGPNYGEAKDENDRIARLRELNSSWGETNRKAVLVPPSTQPPQLPAPQGVMP
jgi:hypothetical protein